ncbi:MAG: cache domain-containing protein, partial [Chloroflexota bacterium]
MRNFSTWRLSRFPRISFSNQVMLYGLFFTIIPLMLGNYFILQHEREQMLAQSKRELNILSQALALDILEYIEELKHDAALIATLPEITEMDQAEQAHILPLLREYHNRYGQLAIVNLEGDIELTARPQPFINITHIPSFRQAARGKQDWVIAPALFSDVLVLHMHTPIIDSDRQAQVGVLGSPVPLGNLAVMLSKFDGGMQNSIFILGSDNRILIHQNEALRMSRPDFSHIIFSHNLETPPPNHYQGSKIETQNLIYDPPDGEPVLMSLTRIQGLDWTIVTQKRLAVVLEPLQTLRQIGAMIIASLILISILMSFVVRNRIALPIENLASAASALGKGDSSRPLPQTDHPIDEIRELFVAFAHMRDAVIDRESQLQAFTSSLEGIVKDRTQELEKINVELEEEVEKHKKTASELELSRDEAEQANHAKDAFLARMSHELRTPLNAIIGYADLIQEYIQTDEFEVDDCLTDVGSIHYAANHLLMIINDVLNYSKLEAGKLSMTTSTFSLEQLISYVTPSVNPLIKKNENQLNILKPDGSWIFSSDERIIRQILINLLSNAAKFTNQGTIDLIFEVLRQPQPQSKGNQEASLLITVRDTGIGISREQQNNL